MQVFLEPSKGEKINITAGMREVAISKISYETNLLFYPTSGILMEV